MKKFSRINYVFNEQGFDLTPGTILTRQKPGFLGQNRLHLARVGSIFDNPTGIGNVGALTNGQPHDAELYYANNTTIVLGGNIGNALPNSQARIRFSNSNNAVIAYKHGITQTLNWGNMANNLAHYWNVAGYIRNHNNVFIVNEVVITRIAKVLYSTQNNTSVTLQYDGNGTFNCLGDLIHFNVGLANEAKTVVAMGFPNATHLLFNVIRWNPKLHGFEPHTFASRVFGMV